MSEVNTVATVIALTRFREAHHLNSNTMGLCVGACVCVLYLT
jgi:hypothetical protein